MGAQFAASIAVVGALGWWLDGKFGTSPWLLITGIFAGAVGGFIAMIRAVPASVHPARGGQRDDEEPRHPPT